MEVNHHACRYVLEKLKVIARIQSCTLEDAADLVDRLPTIFDAIKELDEAPRPTSSKPSSDSGKIH